MRPSLILRAPDPEASGGGNRAEEGASVADLATIPRAELDELRSRASTRDRTAEEAQRAARAEWAAALQARDAEHARAIADAERKAAAMERSYKAALLDRELATALAGKPLVAGAATQLIHLWRDAFEVVDADGAIRVVSREGRAVDRAVADRLSSPEFAHFCLPASRGGTAQRGQGRSAAPAPPPAAPRTLGEAVLSRWRDAEVQGTTTSGSPGWGRRR